MLSIERAGGAIADLFHLQAGIFGIGFKDVAVFRMQGAGDKNSAAAGETLGHQNGFGRGGGTVVHGSVGDFLPGELTHQSLKLEDGLKRALGDFRLIGSVGGENCRAG